MLIEPFFDETTSTLTYLVHDGRAGIVIDPVRAYDPKSGVTSWAPAERVAARVEELALALPYVLDTHAHADHLTALPLFRERFGARSVTGARVGDVQARFRDLLNLGAGFPVDGRQFDVLVEEGEHLGFGSLELTAMHTPGHTPAHMSWCLGDALFLGDTLFMPDHGSARCDFPGGSAAELWQSVQRIYALPDATRLFVCHDYQPGGRPLAYQTTVAAQKATNVQIDASTGLEDYVRFRAEKDATLEAPVLIWPSIQVNLRAGGLPEPEDNGVSYLKIPLDLEGLRMTDDRREVAGTIEEIAPAAAFGRLVGFTVVDVRETHELDGPLGHIAGAVHVPLAEVGGRAPELAQLGPLLLVCRSGKRSATACAELARRDAGPAVNLGGGMIAWNRAGLPVERTPPGAPAELVAAVIAYWAQVSGRQPGEVRQALAAAGHVLEGPSPDGLRAIVDALEGAFPAGRAPADLDLALAHFRELLAAR